jgi:hypothetical protein
MGTSHIVKKSREIGLAKCRCGEAAAVWRIGGTAVVVDDTDLLLKMRPRNLSSKCPPFNIGHWLKWDWLLGLNVGLIQNGAIYKGHRKSYFSYQNLK